MVIMNRIFMNISWNYWFMILWLNWLCVETLWMYKRDIVKELYSGGVYSGGCSLSGRGGQTDTGDAGSCPGPCKTYAGESSNKFHREVCGGEYGTVYTKQVNDKKLYEQDIKRKKGKRNHKKDG